MTNGAMVLELLLVFGVVGGLGAWQLWSLHRDDRRDPPGPDDSGED